jgi:multimeric flavodoxin WrbA
MEVNPMNSKIVILDGLSTENQNHQAAETLIKLLQEQKKPYHLFNLSKSNIGLCISCGVCGKVTPGLCFRKDDGAELTGRLSQGTLLIILTKVRYGALDRRVKLAIDRAALLGLPSFEIRRKQLFHKPRYKTRPFDMLVYASSQHEQLETKETQGDNEQAKLISAEERRVFEEMLQRDSEHFNSEKCKVLWLSDSPKEIPANIKEGIDYIYSTPLIGQVAKHG